MRLCLTALAVAIFSCPSLALAHEASAKGITVAHPWVRATPGGVNLTAAFMEIRASDGVADRLLSVSTAAAGKVELHTHVHEGDVMKMRKIEVLDLTGGTSHVLKPGGDHLMLMDLPAPLKEGDLVALNLVFEKAGDITVEATVEPVGALGPHGFDHQPGTADDPSSEKGAQHQHHH